LLLRWGSEVTRWRREREMGDLEDAEESKESKLAWPWGKGQLP